MFAGAFLWSGISSVNGQAVTQPVQQKAVVQQKQVLPTVKTPIVNKTPVVQEKAPVMVEPASGRILTKYPRETKFEWKSVQGAKSYELDVEYNDGQWKELKMVKTEGLTSTVDFIGDNPGRWRVRAIFEGGKDGPWSAMWGFSYKTGGTGSTGTNTGAKSGTGQKPAAQELPAPQLVSPAAGAVLNNFPRVTQFSWDKVEGAKSYQIQVQYNDGAWKNLKVEMVGTMLTYRCTFVGAQPGRWRVRAFEEGKGGKFSEWREFKYTK
jgi:hypothetical protein